MPTLISDRVSKMSSFVRAILEKKHTTEVTLLFCGSQSIESCTKIQCIKVSHAEKPLTMWAYLTKTRSNHPQRLFLPVVTPTSLPLDCKRAPVSWISVRRTHYSAKTIADLLIEIFNYDIKFSRKHILYFLEPHSRFTLVSEYIFYYFSRTFSASYNNTCTNANIYLLREICL